MVHVTTYTKNTDNKNNASIFVLLPFSRPFSKPRKRPRLQHLFDDWEEGCVTPCRHPETLPDDYSGPKPWEYATVELEDGTQEVQLVFFFINFY